MQFKYLKTQNSHKQNLIYKVFQKKISREYGLQRELPKGKIEHSVINKSNFADLRHISQPYLRLDVLCLAFVFATHSNKIQNKSGFGI